jgi:hypothetical protein
LSLRHSGVERSFAPDWGKKIIAIPKKDNTLDIELQFNQKEKGQEEAISQKSLSSCPASFNKKGGEHGKDNET